MRGTHGDMTCVNGGAVLKSLLLVLGFFTPPLSVTPAQVGVHQEMTMLIVMDSRLRGNDECSGGKYKILKTALFSGRGVTPHRR